jgi:hypothetical protein
MEQKKETTVFHLHLKKQIPDKQDYYFGSIAAIYKVFTPRELKIQASSLYNYKLDVKTNPVYENDICRIRKDILISKKHRK